MDGKENIRVPSARKEEDSQVHLTRGQALRSIWDLIVGSFGLVGCAILLMVPHLRDTQSWIIFGGAAGILPMSRLIDWLVTTGGKK